MYSFRQVMLAFPWLGSSPNNAPAEPIDLEARCRFRFQFAVQTVSNYFIVDPKPMVTSYGNTGPWICSRIARGPTAVCLQRLAHSCCRQLCCVLIRSLSLLPAYHLHLKQTYGPACSPGLTTPCARSPLHLLEDFHFYTYIITQTVCVCILLTCGK